MVLYIKILYINTETRQPCQTFLRMWYGFFLEIHDNCFSKTGDIIKSKCTPCLKNRTLLQKGNFLIAGMLFNRYTTAALITTF